MTAALFLTALICTAAGGLCTGLAIARADARHKALFTIFVLRERVRMYRQYAEACTRQLAQQQAAKARYEQECG